MDLFINEFENMLSYVFVIIKKNNYKYYMDAEAYSYFQMKILNALRNNQINFSLPQASIEKYIRVTAVNAANSIRKKEKSYKTMLRESRATFTEYVQPSIENYDSDFTFKKIQNPKHKEILETLLEVISEKNEVHGAIKEAASRLSVSRDTIERAMKFIRENYTTKDFHESCFI